MHHSFGGLWAFLILARAEPMYGDFFDPRKVRFHEEVKVKKIRPKGKGLLVNTPAYWVEEMGDDEDFEGFGGEERILNGHLDLDQDYEEDSENDDDDAGDNDDEVGEDEDEDEDSEEDEDEDEDSEEDDQGAGQKGRQAVERLKDDLFAAENSEEQSEGGKSDSFDCGLF